MRSSSSANSLSTKRVPKVRVTVASMSPRQWGLVALTAIAAVTFGVGLMTGLNRLLTRPTLSTVAVDPAAAPGAAAAPPAVPRIKATLYFQSEDGLHLVATEREVPLAEGAVAQARALIEAQLSTGPPAPLVATIPDGTTLRGLFVSSRNEAFVDLDATVRDRHPGGSMNELLTVYTIVNAITTNLPDVQTVQVLINGREVDTLAGHVDLRRPLRKNEALIIP